METDSFNFRILDKEKAPTRRGIPTVISSMYDPLRFVEPCLELAAVVVAVKLNCLIENELEYPIDETIFGTDSTVVLQHTRNESRRFQTFFANRVAMIHEESTPKKWRHGNTESYPADVTPRGAKGSELHKMDLWLHGPMFLRMDEVS